MEKTQKGILLMGIVFCLLITLQGVSAADYYVNNDTTHKNISDWMKNSAKNGDNLIFNSSSYELTNTLVISKSVNIKSNKNTEINFYLDKNMFYITAKSVNFTNLRLKHVSEGKDYSTSGKYGMIVAKGDFKQINIKNTNINFQINNDNLQVLFDRMPGYFPPQIWFSAIKINNWKGNIQKCNISTKGELCSGIDVENWKGNIINSKIRTEGKNNYFTTIKVIKWKGNLINSSISSCGTSSNVIHGDFWTGKISDSKIYSIFTGKFQLSEILTGIYLPNSKGLIEKSIIKYPYGYAVMISDNVKIEKSKLSSKKGFKKILRCRPDLMVNHVSKSKNTYDISLHNQGYGKSKPFNIIITTGTGKILKKVKIKSIMGDRYEFVKIKLPMKYANKYYTKYIQFDNYKQNKKDFKDNYFYEFKF